MPKPRTDICPYSADELASIYAQHKSCTKVAALCAEQHGITVRAMTVANWCKRRGIDLVPPGGANNPHGYGGKSGKRPEYNTERNESNGVC